MSRFAPNRASSPPRRSCVKPPSVLAQDLLDNSRTSILSSVQELTNLSPDQLDFIDSVIQRASATATTFLSVFKAYNEVLQERGLDPQNEVVYYGKLLKLGTLKGKNWGEKWDMVKRQQTIPRDSDLTPRPSTSRPQQPLSRAKVLTRLTGALKAIERNDDTFTLRSHQGETEDGRSDAVSATEDSEADNTADNPLLQPPPPRLTSPTLTSNSLGLDTGPHTRTYPSKAASSISRARAPYPYAPRLPPPTWDAETSEATGSTGRASTALRPPSMPPSYSAVVRNTAALASTGYTPLRALAQAQSRTTATAVSSLPPPAAYTAPDTSRAVVQQARQRKGSVINEEDAWKKIRMAQDEKEADHFREDKLIERCWQVWKQGYEWIITTNDQIGEARQSLVIRRAWLQWRERTTERLTVYNQVAAASDARLLRHAVHAWQVKLKERQQIKWRADMRARMKTVRDAHDKRLVHDAWAVWLLKHRAEAADRVYLHRLATKVLARWQQQVAKVGVLESAVVRLGKKRDKGQLQRCWILWRRAVDLRRAEAIMAERIELRVLTNAFDVWKGGLQESRAADHVYDRFLLRRTLLSWKAARDRLQLLDRRVMKHVGRQNDVLVRAVWRVWKAHERGKLLERVRNTRLLKQTWTRWQDQLREQHGREDLALAFSTRPSSLLASSTLHKWLLAYRAHQASLSYAANYHSMQLQHRMLAAWRLQTRGHAQQVKVARKAEKFFVQRACWKRWVEKIAARKRERKVKEFEGRIVGKYLREWHKRTQKEQQRKLIGEVIEGRVNLRIMANALSHWTTRVADIKFRELEVAQQNDKDMMAGAFKKWKNLCIRHVEELSLMESYQDVKREEQMRRMFYRWLSAARKARTKRLLLQEKEEQLKLGAVTGAWEKWRERFLDIKLQPMADTFLVRRQQYIVFRAFGIWHSKSTSLPAVRFHALHLKSKYWKVWRDGMPRALQSKHAREADRKAVLSKAFAKWLQAYKTKLELKAVARARYLRLPTAAPRQIGGPIARSMAPPRTTTTTTRKADPPASTVADSEAGDESDAPPARPAQVASTSTRLFAGRRLGIASLLSERPRSPERPDRRSRLREQPLLSPPARPKLASRAGTTRAPSPVPSTTSMGAASRYSEPVSRLSVVTGGAGRDVGRSQLWQELRGIQLKSRPVTESSRSRGLP